MLIARRWNDSRKVTTTASHMAASGVGERPRYRPDGWRSKRALGTLGSGLTSSVRPARTFRNARRERDAQDPPRLEPAAGDRPRRGRRARGPPERGRAGHRAARRPRALRRALDRLAGDHGRLDPRAGSFASSPTGSSSPCRSPPRRSPATTRATRTRRSGRCSTPSPDSCRSTRAAPTSTSGSTRASPRRWCASPAGRSHLRSTTTSCCASRRWCASSSPTRASASSSTSRSRARRSSACCPSAPRCSRGCSATWWASTPPATCATSRRRCSASRRLDRRGPGALGGREVRVGVFPMGVDAASFAASAEAPGVADEVRALRAGGRATAARVDRLDYTKGIPRRLLAYERLLRERPDLRGRVRLVQVAVPSRTEVGAYQGSAPAWRRWWGGSTAPSRRRTGRHPLPVARPLARGGGDALPRRRRDAGHAAAGRDEPRGEGVRGGPHRRRRGAGALGVHRGRRRAGRGAPREPVRPRRHRRRLQRALEMPEDERRTRMAALRRRVVGLRRGPVGPHLPRAAGGGGRRAAPRARGLARLGGPARRWSGSARRRT